jgi:hypothetical protein
LLLPPASTSSHRSAPTARCACSTCVHSSTRPSFTSRATDMAVRRKGAQRRRARRTRAAGDVGGWGVVLPPVFSGERRSAARASALPHPTPCAWRTCRWLWFAGSPVPLIRLAWNKQDPNYLATLTMDSNKVIILDIRVPSLPAAVLDGHSQCVNGLAWAPHSSCHICTAADDNQALIWDLSTLGQKQISGARRLVVVGGASPSADARCARAMRRPDPGVLRGVGGQPVAVVEGAARLGRHLLRQKAADLAGLSWPPRMRAPLARNLSRRNVAGAHQRHCAHPLSVLLRNAGTTHAHACASGRRSDRLCTRLNCELFVVSVCGADLS